VKKVFPTRIAVATLRGVFLPVAWRRNSVILIFWSRREKETSQMKRCVRKREGRLKTWIFALNTHDLPLNLCLSCSRPCELSDFDSLRVENTVFFGQKVVKRKLFFSSIFLFLLSVQVASLAFEIQNLNLEVQKPLEDSAHRKTEHFLKISLKTRKFKRIHALRTV
jgi:hypothetical protein